MPRPGLREFVYIASNGRCAIRLEVTTELVPSALLDRMLTDIESGMPAPPAPTHLRLER